VVKVLNVEVFMKLQVAVEEPFRSGLIVVLEIQLLLGLI